jgi:gamma-glutamyltranspeptidase/glutathione hydrolase
MPGRGIVAAGHQSTAEAAIEILRAGGNAFDAMVAALFAASVAEPVLSSLGGGGFLLAHTHKGQTGVMDFFVQTPRHKRPHTELDFYPIIADFGTSQQEFHIGQAAIATPGMPRGLFAMHAALGSMPMRELVEPAIELATQGVRLNTLQSYIFSIVAPIYLASDSSRQLYESSTHPGSTLQEGELFRNPDYADFLDVLANEGVDLFYCGEVARQIAEDSLAGGGYIGMDDLSGYEVEDRTPLESQYRGARIWTNPPPSSGGILIALGLRLLESLKGHEWPASKPSARLLLAEVMRQTAKARLDAHIDETTAHMDLRMLDPEYLQRYINEVRGRAQAMRGTTHISIMDGQGNIATSTVSNGEGCGHILKGTGVMLNNMLGEEDLNPHGFHHWAANQRMTSMMSPSICELSDGRIVAMGSGGSNRIRTALLQVITNLVDHDMDIEQAVLEPRIHLEGEKLSIEGGHDAHVIEALTADFGDHVVWDERNLFFGGAHCVVRETGGGLSGIGDPRRDGVAITA